MQKPYGPNIAEPNNTLLRTEQRQNLRNHTASQALRQNGW